MNNSIMQRANKNAMKKTLILLSVMSCGFTAWYVYQGDNWHTFTWLVQAVVCGYAATKFRSDK